MRHNHSNVISLIILLLLLAVGIGYASLQGELNINGTATIGDNTWDIHFANIQVEDGSVSTDSSAEIDSTDNTKINFGVTLVKPGDFYEFTVDIVNSGTIDGMIESFTSTINNQPISNLPTYLEYSLTYSEGEEIANNHLLEANRIEPIRVKISFKEDIDTNDLPTSTNQFNFSIDLNYIQSDSTAIPIPNV